jgi:putative ABC transport system ATP-binding protein
MIELDEIKKIYHMGEMEVGALQGVSLTIQEGEMVAIMGPSGSGKSTMMNVIGCLDMPTSGHYYLDGEDVGNLSDDRLATIRGRQIGFVFQTYNLLPRMSAQSNVELPLVYSNLKNRKQRALDALERVGLGDRAGHKPTELSGGQQQRVGIARALVKEPSILLADEPTGNLDSTSSEEIMAILTSLNEDDGLTVVIVTHEPEIAAQTNRVITMLDGKMISDTVKEQPELVTANEPD